MNPIQATKAKGLSPFILYEPYQPPFDYEGVISFHRSHQIANLEWFNEGRMHRVIAADGKMGQVVISNDPDNSRLIVEVDFPDKSILNEVSLRVRSLFDLDCDPVAVQKAISLDPGLEKLLKKHPGLRVPGGWDAFELAVQTILGQGVSIGRARALIKEFIELIGKDTGYNANAQSVKLFPMPEDILSTDLTPLKTTTIRKEALKGLSQALINKEFSLAPDQDMELFIKKIISIKGIGSWTANYLALKFLHRKDAFPANDLIIARALKFHPLEVIETMRPWRGYVAILLWKSYAGTLKKS